LNEADQGNADRMAAHQEPGSGAVAPAGSAANVLVTIMGVVLPAVLAAILAATLWWPAAHGPRPPLPTDDLYTNLTVTRHLARGEGFLCDISYPLSFAWPFARELPQPLLHRPPGWPLALLAPYAIAGSDPDGTVRAVRWLQVALLAWIAGQGTLAWWRRGRAGAAAGWLAPLLASPLIAYAVDWGQVELVTAALLLALWLRHRDTARAPGAIDGALLGGLALVRPELTWLPVVWWLARRPGKPGPIAFVRRDLVAAAVVFLALTAPWAARNARLTGNPWFSLQSHAELVKDTRTWPGYDVYRQLNPQPAWRALRDDPVPIARKAARGVRFFLRELPALAPWPLLLALGLAAAAAARTGRVRRPAAGAVSARWPAMSPAALALLSAVALGGLYALFDHSLRHLTVLVPILVWEAAPWLGEWPWSLLPRRRARRRPAVWAAAGALAVTLPITLLTVREPDGWDQAAREATAWQDRARQEAGRLREAPPGIVFTESSAAPWLADRPAVWSPLDDDVAARITAWLEAAAATGDQP
jgi:hypothetical protein